MNCPSCGEKAYVGFNTVECANPGCIHCTNTWFPLPADTAIVSACVKAEYPRPKVLEWSTSDSSFVIDTEGMEPTDVLLWWPSWPSSSPHLQLRALEPTLVTVRYGPKGMPELTIKSFTLGAGQIIRFKVMNE